MAVTSSSAVLSDGKKALQLSGLPAALGTVYARVRVVSKEKIGDHLRVIAQGYQVDASGTEVAQAPARTVTVYFAQLAAGNVDLPTVRKNAIAACVQDLVNYLTAQSNIAEMPSELVS